jgi:hypothetical protein
MAKDDKDTQTATGDKKVSEMTQEELVAFFGSASQQSGTNYLSGYGYPSRIIKGPPAEGVVVDPKDFQTTGGGGAGGRTVYQGPLLVDENGIVRRPQYDLNPLTDSNTILLELIKNPTQYKYFTNLLQTRGYYGNSKPSTNRVDSVDRSAMAEFLNNVANANGVTYKTAFQILEGTPQLQASGKKAPSVRLPHLMILKLCFVKRQQICWVTRLMMRRHKSLLKRISRWKLLRRRSRLLVVCLLRRLRRQLLPSNKYFDSFNLRHRVLLPAIMLRLWIDVLKNWVRNGCC